MPLPPSHRAQEGLEALRQVDPDIAELAAAISDALDAEGVDNPEVAQEIIYWLCRRVHQHPHAGGPPLLALLKTWYLEGALSQTAFSILTLHATALIDA
ncbi:hypothetical protein [Pseudomonas fluorescens]|uniref:Uncharacterized protein n=1 Tax=Pseudomonas fluorescens TaxID=294 RepID=A0A5E7C1X3_PSEFL|nr:hypothetical protein [Pseudomonas fluorescens]VVN98185.1 hypothetical protein PS723_02424 [Pseudomonas fluorescens]